MFLVRSRLSFYRSFTMMFGEGNRALSLNIPDGTKRVSGEVQENDKTNQVAPTESLHVDIGDLRKKYRDKTDTFTEDDIPWKHPMSQFRIWFDDAIECPEIKEPNSMVLATSTKNGIPSARNVLLKSFELDGFVFYTNYESRKAKELAENPRAALAFYWEPLNRCVRVEGTVQKVPPKQSDTYFSQRPRESQIGAVASRQSSVISGRQELLKAVEDVQKTYEGISIPRPDYWGGYIVLPEVLEFWQGQSTRLHDRIRFRRLNGDEKPDGVKVKQGLDDWVYETLSP